MTIENLQYQLSNGTWMDCISEMFGDRTEEFMTRCEKNNAMTRDEVVAALDAGQTLRNAPEDWYSNCRIKPAPVERVAVEMVRCDCGHSTPVGTAMNASTGTSCPDCYDRMSN